MEGNSLLRISRSVKKIGLCCECQFPLTVGEDLVSRRGLVSKLIICCTNTACNNEVALSDPYSPEAKSLNARSVLAMREYWKRAF